MKENPEWKAAVFLTAPLARVEIGYRVVNYYFRKPMGNGYLNLTSNFHSGNMLSVVGSAILRIARQWPEQIQEPGINFEINYLLGEGEPTSRRFSWLLSRQVILGSAALHARSKCSIASPENLLHQRIGEWLAIRPQISGAGLFPGG